MDAAPSKDLEALLTVEQVAAYLHLSRTTVYRLTWQKALRTVRVGSRIRVPASAIADYLRTTGIQP